uniref:protein kinase domain-containing protein n=1 Tax=Streptomyces sp. NRRL S-920 TaxID=1463921 RepID=UPI0004CBCB2D
DFGIATSRGDSTLTATGMVIGSLPYLSPERAQGLKAQPPSDLFALGTTLYEAVEGTCPFKRESPAGSLHAVAYEDVPPMKRAGHLQPLIELLLEKNPANRPTATEALELLNSSRSTSAPKPKPEPKPKQDSPAAAAVAPVDKKPSEESDWGAGLACIGCLLGVLLLLYASEESFASWVSGGLNGHVSSARAGDCVHETGDVDEHRTWVQVSCD